MGSVDHGAQRASRLRPLIGRSTNWVAEPPSGPTPPHRHPLAVATTHTGVTPAPRTPPARRTGQRWLAILLLAGVAVTAIGNPPMSTAASTGGVLMSPAELAALPTSGSAWTAVKAVADAPLGTPNLCNQDANHHLRTLAAALVYARTGTASYGTKARAAVMSALPTQTIGCGNAVLALGRQLTAYVVAADLASLAGTDDTTFRAWLTAIRAKQIGGHPVWNSLVGTHRLSPNNWGAYAGAARIAADVYIGDTGDLASASKVTRGFLGDRTAYSSFTDNLSSAAISWACTGNVLTYTPVNGACTLGGINVDGGVAADISRGGALRWPPADPGIPYQLDGIQGLGLQVELLSRHGYADAWSWSSSALKRMAAIVTRSGAAGGTAWNGTITGRQMPWLLNRRYGTQLPTAASGMGRAIGFTDWLYGSGSGSAAGPTPAPTKTPTPTPKPTSTPAPTATPTTNPTPSKAEPPQVSGPRVTVGSTSIPLTGSPVRVGWTLGSSADGVRRYDLQVSRDGGSWASLSLASTTATARWVIQATGRRYSYRVRATDLAGRVGPWSTVGPVKTAVVGDGSTSIVYRKSWGSAAATAYIGRTVHYSRTSGATATLRFSGSGVVLVGPKGPGRGRSTVFIDGRAIVTIDQYASSFAARRVLFARNLSPGTHTITVKALGTTGRPMVAIDAIQVLTPA